MANALPSIDPQHTDPLCERMVQGNHGIPRADHLYAVELDTPRSPAIWLRSDPVSTGSGWRHLPGLRHGSSWEARVRSRSASPTKSEYRPLLFDGDERC
jgi:hypothetical protein